MKFWQAMYLFFQFNTTFVLECCIWSLWICNNKSDIQLLGYELKQMPFPIHQSNFDVILNLFFFQSWTEMILKWPQKITSFWSGMSENIG